MHSTQAPEARSQNGVPGIEAQSASWWQGPLLPAPPAPPLGPPSPATTMKSPTPKMALQPARTVPPARANSPITRIQAMLAHAGRATNIRDADKLRQNLARRPAEPMPAGPMPTQGDSSTRARVAAASSSASQAL
jgi:hypothetical protein